MEAQDSRRETLISYRNVELCLDSYVVLKSVSFDIRQGEFVYLVGKVGSGKSTLLKSIYAEVPVRECPLSAGGPVAEVFDYDLMHLKRRKVQELRRRLGIVFQDFRLLSDRNVHDNLRFVLGSTEWKDRHTIEERIEAVLKQVGMENKGYKMPHELSGGEQQRIVIARALLNSPDIILADEPTGNLDPETADAILQLLHNICAQGTTVVMTTHNHSFLEKYPGRVLTCEDHLLKETAPTEETTSETLPS